MVSSAVRASIRVSALSFALFVGACAPSPAPSLPPASVPGTLAPSPTDTTTVSGEVEISNTTPGGDPVLIETIAVHLETSPADQATWTALTAPCDTDPQAPVTFEDRLTVRYECDPGTTPIPSDVRLRAVVEATIAGSDELFRLESELSR